MLVYLLYRRIKAFLLFTILLGAITTGYCQHKDTDSLINIIKYPQSDSARVEAMYYLSYAYQVYKPDSALLVAQQLYDFALEKGQLRGQSIALDAIAGAFLRIGDNTKALEYYLDRLKLEEKRNIPDNIATIDMNIANVYNRDRDTAKAIKYILKADSIIAANNVEDLKPYLFLNAGNIFEKSNRLSEALSYTGKCYQLALATHDTLMIGSALNNLGNIFYKLGDMVAAIKNYRQSQTFIEAAKDNQTLSEGYLGLAQAYQNKGQNDSALYFAKLSYNISDGNKLLSNVVASSQLLAALYKEKGSFDSAFAYQTTMLRLKDSLQGIERVKQLESITIQEQLRQLRLAAQREKEKEEYRQRLQLLVIGIAIPFFFLFSIYISRRKIHRRVIQFFGILSLLLFFEYLTLLLHPFVAELAHHSPLLEIVIFVGIAALVVPMHHKIEHWFTKHLSVNYETARKRKQKGNQLPENNQGQESGSAFSRTAEPLPETETNQDFEKSETTTDPGLVPGTGQATVADTDAPLPYDQKNEENTLPQP